MPAKRATVYFDPDIHRALRLKAAASDDSMSDIVNRAVRLSLAEDAEDLEAFQKRKREPNLDFEQFVKALKRRRNRLQGSTRNLVGRNGSGALEPPIPSPCPGQPA